MVSGKRPEVTLSPCPFGPEGNKNPLHIMDQLKSYKYLFTASFKYVFLFPFSIIIALIPVAWVVGEKPSTAL